MDNVSIQAAFAADHADLDRSFERFRNLKTIDFARAKVAFHAFRHDLCHHMRREEEVLFAAIERRLGSQSGPTAVMHAEHRRILRALDRLEAKIESGTADCGEEEATLIELLETHDFKEEKVLYPMIDRILDAEERRRLLGDLEQAPVEGVPTCCT